MKLISIRSLPSYKSIEDLCRESFICKLSNVQLTGRNIHYPNCLLDVSGALIHPYDERVMSLQRDSFYQNDEWNRPKNVPEITEIYESPVFFFHYNVDNYYHFLYDTLPYLYSYKLLLKEYPTLKAILQTSHPTKKELPAFVKEFLNLLEISYIFGSKTTLYKTLFLSTSFTHGQKSNNPYSPCIASIWKELPLSRTYETPKRFYISRRSWIHGKTDNIGTNYTQRRKCVNEDAVVKCLKSYGIEEVFTELLTTEEKIAYFRQAELVVGIVGGGMCNLLFSPSSTRAICINTPYFLDINYRFKHSMDHTDITYLDCATHELSNYMFPLYSRVCILNQESSFYNSIGEIESIENGIYIVKLMNNDMAGFSQDINYIEQTFYEKDLESLDPGLNSPFVCNIEKLEHDINIGLFSV